MSNLPQPEWDAAYLDAEGEMMEMPACWGCASPLHTTAAPFIKAPVLMLLALDPHPGR